MVGIMQPYFFPYIGYFQLIHAVDTYVNLDHVSFMKRSYMTRNVLRNKININVNVYNGSQNKKCTEVYVNFENRYILGFLNTLHHLYSKSPQYNSILDKIILPEFIEQEITISSFNINIIKRICEYLDITTNIIDTSTNFNNTHLKKEEGLKTITKQLNDQDYVNAIGGQKLYDKENFKKDNINLFFLKTGEVAFENKYSSILDLLFVYSKEHIKNQLLIYTLL